MTSTARPLYELMASDFLTLEIECVFGLMSDDTARLVTALDAAGIRFHGARHENTAVAMAEGYSAASGRMGVAVIGRGPAAANAIHGATYAKRAGSRVLLVFGEAPLLKLSGPDGKAFDTVGALRAAGIPVFLPTDAVNARQLLRDAVHATASQGAIALLLPSDLQAQLVEPEFTEPQPGYAAAPALVAPRRVALDAVVRLLQGCRKPLIIAGQGAYQAGAKDALIELADRIGAAVATTLKARSLFRDHPFDCGIVGSFSHSAGRRIIEQADCVLVFGAGLNHRTTSNGHGLPTGVPVVHVDENHLAIGRWFPADIALVADARLTAQALHRLLPERTAAEKPLRSADIRRLLAEFDPAGEFKPAHTPRTVDPRSLAIQFDRILPADRNTVYDTGNFLQIVPFLSVKGPRQMKLTADFSSIGMGFGTALGYACGSQDRTTVLFMGDGSFFMTMGELETAAREDIPLVIIVLNDCAYGAELHYLRQIDLPVQMSVFPDVDLAPIAEAFGFQVATIRSMDDLEAVAQLLSNPQGPIFLDCKINSSIPAPFLSEKRG